MKPKIFFSCDYTNRRNISGKDLLNYSLYELTKEEDESTFSIILNGRDFFSTSGFNTLEFMQQIQLWKIEKGDFNYNCIDTDENPLLSFIEKDGCYTIYSPWQKFSCSHSFSFEELISCEKILG